MQKITADVMPLYSVPPEDAKLFTKWVYDVRHRVSFDMDTLNYPRSCMTLAKQGDETVMMIPLQPVLMFESMVRKPDLSPRQAAMCMWRIGEQVEQAMTHTGHREAYFLTNDAQEVETCSRHGWTVCLQDTERGQWLMKRKTEIASQSSIPKV